LAGFVAGHDFGPISCRLDLEYSPDHFVGLANMVTPTQRQRNGNPPAGVV